METVGTFRVNLEIENPARLGEKRALQSVLVDTGAELSWIPGDILRSLGVEHNARWRFRQADGSVLERWTGIVVVTVAGRRTGDDVVFGEPGDLTLLGARTLEGLNVRVDPVSRALVDAGPAPAAASVGRTGGSKGTAGTGSPPTATEGSPLGPDRQTARPRPKGVL